MGELAPELLVNGESQDQILADLGVELLRCVKRNDFNKAKVTFEAIKRRTEVLLDYIDSCIELNNARGCKCDHDGWICPACTNTEVMTAAKLHLVSQNRVTTRDLVNRWFTSAGVWLTIRARVAS